MNSDWPKVRLGDHVDSCLGKMLDAKKNKGTPQPYLGNSDVRWGMFDLKNLSEMRFESHEEDRYGLLHGDLVVCEGGEPGRCAIWTGKAGMKIQKALHRIRPKQTFNNYYLFYWFMHAAKSGLLEPYFTGTTIKHLTGKAVAALEVPQPPIEIQQAMVDVLKSLDDRIALLRETNATLESMTQALFKSWFVDFDPVHANAGVTTPTLPPELQNLFPSTVHQSPLGPIPAGWSVCPLDSAAHFLNGLALQKFPPTGDEFIPVIKIAQLRKGDTSGADRASRDLKPEYIIHDGDVLFSWSGSLEVTIWCGGEGALNQHLFKVTSDKFSKWFYYLWTKHHLPKFQKIAASKATTMGHIQRKHLTEATVIIPSCDVLHAADEVFGPLIEKFITNSIQAKNLAELRDSLLPRLLSGKLRLQETEQNGEEFIN
jgi:type I restriction enzyme S subunit